MIKALVLDDEAIIAADITYQLNSREGWNAEAETNVDKARARILAERFDVLFLDIEMPGCDGMTFAGELNETSPDLHVIFSTAYPQHAAQAFRLSALDYIVKPLSRGVLAEACERVEKKKRSPIFETDAPKFVIKSFGRTDLVPMSDVVVARAERNYVALMCGEKEYLHRSTISEMEKDLGAVGCIRCHRSYIVKKAMVQSLLRKNGVLSHLKLVSGEEVPVGANYRSQVQAALVDTQ